MKRILIVVVLSMLVCSTGLAQQTTNDTPATKEDVQKYLDAVHSHDMMKQMMAAMSGPMHKMVHDQFVKNQDKLPADFEAHMNTMLDEMLQGSPWDQVEEAMMPVYQKHFTKNELEALTAFYSSPIGQKVLREMPALMAESMEVTMPLMQEHMKTVMDRLQQRLADALKESQSSKPRPALKN